MIAPFGPLDKVLAMRALQPLHHPRQLHQQRIICHHASTLMPLRLARRASAGHALRTHGLLVEDGVAGDEDRALLDVAVRPVFRCVLRDLRFVLLGDARWEEPLGVRQGDRHCAAFGREKVGVRYSEAEVAVDAFATEDVVAAAEDEDLGGRELVGADCAGSFGDGARRGDSIGVISRLAGSGLALGHRGRDEG